MGIYRNLVLVLLFIAFGVAEAKQSDTCEAALAPVSDEERLSEIKKIWAQIEDFWALKVGRKLPASVLVIYSGQTESACGKIVRTKGPLYCRLDGKTYVDLEQWDRIAKDFKAPGIGAFVYMLAHEYAHHLQKVWGVLDDLIRLNQEWKEEQPHWASQVSVSMELWADALAGYFIRHLSDTGRMDQEEVVQAINGAARMGDDWSWLTNNNYPMPKNHLLTHGTGTQRQDWFMRGFEGYHWFEKSPAQDDKFLTPLPESVRARLQIPFHRLLRRPPY